MRRRKKAGRTKPVSYELIKPESPAGESLYRIMAELIEKHHEDLKPARIALAWNLSWKPDVDGRVTLGKCKKASDLDRELAEFDFVIILRKEFFEDAAVQDFQRRALLDHELCHAAPKLNESGEQIEDAKGRKVWRLRKHDIEEFSSIVARHGLYKRDLEEFAAALRLAKQGRLSMDDVAGRVLDAVRQVAPKPGSGIESVEISMPGSGLPPVKLTQADRARMDAEHRERP